MKSKVKSQMKKKKLWENLKAGSKDDFRLVIMMTLLWKIEGCTESNYELWS